jgi:hypothetical protein
MLARSYIANLFLADYLRQAPAWFYSRILVGAGPMLTPNFVRTHNITHVINCADESACPTWFKQAYPTRYKCLNAIDSPFANILSWYPLFEGTLHAFLKEGHGTVFVHCQCGINRSAFLALTYVCKNFNLPLLQMIQSMRQQRPIMFQNSVFMGQVEEFINGRLSSSKNTGNEFERNKHGDSGLCPPRDDPKFEIVANSSGGTAM